MQHNINHCRAIIPGGTHSQVAVSTVFSVEKHIFVLATTICTRTAHFYMANLFATLPLQSTSQCQLYNLYTTSIPCYSLLFASFIYRIIAIGTNLQNCNNNANMNLNKFPVIQQIVLNQRWRHFTSIPKSSGRSKEPTVWLEIRAYDACYQPFH